MKNAGGGVLSYATINVIDNDYIAPILFYKYYYLKYNQHIIISTIKAIKANDIIIVKNDSLKNLILTKYQTQQLEIFKNATIYKIIK